MPTLVTRTRAARLAAAGLMAAAALAVTTPAATAAPSTASGIVAPALSISAATPASEVPKGSRVWVTGKALKLRVDASSSSRVVAVAYRNSVARTTGRTQGKWVQVRLAGRLTAWTTNRFLTTVKPAWDPTYVRTLGKDLGLREGPNNSTPIVTRASKATKGIFTGIEKNGWWQVKINGTYAWTPSRFLSVNGTFDKARILNVAHSQVGYREPAWRDNPYNDWINGNNAWCSVFVSWVFDQARYANGVPKEKHFDDYVAALRKAGVLDTTPTAKEIKKGDVVLIDWYPYNGPTHTGIVDHVSGDSIYLVEGNTTSGTGSTTRGVFYRERAMVDVHASYRPSDYAWAVELASK